ncbi:MAG: DNA polymerase III subunit gamma/tau [Clostridia bacterium]|nr:DNA polymerase III subunit gamma/tau [Clostridia bacterium]
MAYLALYRTFRPSSLDEVVRQEHIVTVLKNQIATGRIGHAYLFCGPRGTGKTSIAKIFAASINCETPVGGSPCGKCATCKALADPSNLDISEIDAASNNGVDEMRDLREKVQYPPVAGKYKVYIIDEVHMLSTGAFNALLKTLEEPPRHAVFILATTEAAKIPATILSRCMRFDFKLIPQADLEERLKFVFDSIGKKYDEEAVAAIARAGAGSVRDMLSIADTCVSYTSGKLTYEDVTAVLGSADFDGVAQMCEAALVGDTGAAFEGAERFLSAGKSVGTLVKDTMNFLNSCTVAKTCRDGKNILALPDATYARIEKIAKSVNGHRLLRAAEIFAEAEQNLKYSSSPRIVFETAVMKASMPESDYDIEALIARVAELEKRLAEGAFVQKDGGRVATNEKTEEVETVPAPVKKEEKELPVSAEEEFAPPELEAPPDEAVTGGNVYFDEGYIPKKKPPQERAPIAPRATVGQATKGDAKLTFGQFLRSLRRTGKSGVVYTICMDLDSSYEGELFLLETQSDTIFRSLQKAEHYALVKEAFAAIGVNEGEFELRLKGKKSDDFNKSVEEIKATFRGVKVDVK